MLWKVMERLARMLALAPVLVVALAVSIAIHLDAPATRRTIATQLNGVLRDTFRGDVRIDHIGRFGLGGFSNVDVTVRDPDGVQVLHVDNVAVDIDSARLVRSLLAGKGPIVVDVRRAFVGHADVDVGADPSAQLRLATTFAPRNPEPEPSPPSAEPGRSVIVRAPKIMLSHAWVHGQPPGAPLVDADLFDASATANVDGPTVRAKLDRLHLVARSLPAALDPRGSLSGTFESPSETGKGISVVAAFAGDLAGVATNVTANLVDQRIDARIVMNSDRGMAELARPEALHLHAEAHGTLPHVSLHARGGVGDATALVDAELATEPSTNVSGTVRARNVDLAALVPKAPTSRLGVDLTANVTLGDDGVRGDANGALLPSMIDDRNVPRVDIQAHVAGDTARARLWIRDRALPTEVAVDVAPRREREGGQVVSANVKTQVGDLRQIPVIGKTVRGSARVEASARLLLPEQAVERSDVFVETRDLSAPGIEVRHATVGARARGTMEHPIVDAVAHMDELRASSLAFAKIDGRATIEREGSRLSIRDVGVEAARGEGDVVKVTAKRVELRDGSVRVDTATVRGFGEPIQADVALARNEVRAMVDAPRIDLDKVARIAGQKGLATGQVALRADGRLRGGVAHGRFGAELTDVSVRSIKHARAKIDGSIDDRELALRVDADARSAGRIQLATEELRLDRGIDDPRAWQGATGKVVFSGEVDLAKASSLVPAEWLSVADLRGRLTVQGAVTRDADVPPSVQVHVHTVGLVVAAPSGTPEYEGGVEIVGPPDWRSSDVDLGFDLRANGRSGLTDFAFRVDDRHGNVFGTDAKVIVPYRELARRPASARALMLEAPMHVRATIPHRRLEELPSILGLRRTSGEVHAEIDIAGTALDPRVSVLAQGKKLRLTGKALALDPDVEASLNYDGRVADLSAKVTSNGNDLLDVTSHAEASARDLLLGKKAAPWTASGRIALRSFPLEAIPQATDLRLHGRVSGDVTLDDLHRDARARAALDFDGFAIDKVAYRRGIVRLDAGGGRLTGNIRLDQMDGLIDLKAETGMHWGSDVAPSLDKGRPIDARLVAIGFRAAAMAPFVEGTLPELDGRLDADVRARVIPGRPGAELSGTARFHDGRMHVAALGTELHSVRAKASLHPDGSIKVTDIFARSGEGELRGDASAKLDGTTLAEAKASLSIPDRRALDLSIEGVPFGQLAGRVNVEAKQSPDGATAIIVDAPRLAVELPRATRTDVQSLTPHEDIHVGVFRDKDRFTVLPMSKADRRGSETKEASETRMTIDVRLRNVEITRGNSLQIVLAGRPRIEMEGGETKLFGEIRVDRGWLDLQGKRFEIEKGTVAFDGSTPPDPLVNATAGWTAADGTRVLADFVGPVSTGKLSLRSEPPRPKNEVLALIVFGTADGANPPPTQQQGGGGSTTKTAVGLGGGLVAQGLTDALDSLTGLQATARIDTTQSNNPRPEVQVQISPRVTLGFAHVIGTPPITEPDKNFASFDYRFYKNWSLQTRFGDRGSALVDSLWQKRY